MLLKYKMEDVAPKYSSQVLYLKNRLETDKDFNREFYEKKREVYDIEMILLFFSIFPI